MSCKFVKPAIYPADLEVTTYAGKPGRSSFMMFHEMFLAGDPATLYAEAGRSWSGSELAMASHGRCPIGSGNNLPHPPLPALSPEREHGGP